MGHLSMESGFARAVPGGFAPEEEPIGYKRFDAD
jgi:hypothetical protein